MTSLEDLKKELEDKSKYPPEKLIEFNNRPDVKAGGVVAVYKEDEEKKDKKIEKMSKTNKIMFSLILGFLVCAAVITYLAYTDNLKLLNINIPDCPSNPVTLTLNQTCEKQECNPTLICNETYAPTIKLYCNNST